MACFYTPFGVTLFGTHLAQFVGELRGERFYTPFGVTLFGTLVLNIYSNNPYPGFYTPFGVTLFGTRVARVDDITTSLVVSIRPSA